VEVVEAALSGSTGSKPGALDMMSIHTVTEHIKEALRDETTALMADIEHLNVCLEEAAGERHVVKENAVSRVEPTRAELEHFSKKLQAEVANDDMADILDGTGLTGLGGGLGGEMVSPLRAPLGAPRQLGSSTHTVVPPLGQISRRPNAARGPLSVSAGAGGGLSGARGVPSPSLALGAGTAGRPVSSRRVNRLRSMVEDTR
jgi:hypothetical protein